MKEALLQYIWKNSLFEDREYHADTSEKIRIVETGIHNTDGGPDFTQAKIRIDDTLWAGNIEIHKKTSEWNRHQHHTDAAYNNVILHVSLHHDTFCYNTEGRRIPCIEIKFDPKIESRYHKLILDDHMIPCHESLPKLDTSLISFWMSALAIERLSIKTAYIQQLLQHTRNNWEETFFIIIARNFGLKINALPFELLAKSTPWRIIRKHTHKLFELEALLFGQAGFLMKPLVDEYQESLHREYIYLKKKYGLTGIKPHLWKYLRLRPSNFPAVRISQLCSLVHKSKHLFSVTMDCKSVEELVETYSCSVSDYWKYHYKFGKEGQSGNKSLGLRTRMSLIINTIVPFMFIYGKHKNQEQLRDKAVQLLELIPPEQNRIIHEWAQYQIYCRHAADSQALLQLTHAYCNRKECLNCQIGHLVLNNSWNETRES